MSTTQLPAAPMRARRRTLAFGPYSFEPDNQLLRRGDDTISAPPRVLGLLDLLLERAGDLVARQELIDRVWKDAFVTDTSLAEAISVLRQTLGDDPQAPTYIQTVHRRGYRFVAPVEVRERTPPPVLVNTAAGPEAQDEVVSPSIGGQLLPWSAAVLFGLIAAVAIFQLTRRQDAGPQPARFQIDLPRDQRFASQASPVALSPDGRIAAWAACADACWLYLRPLDSLEGSRIPGTEGGALPFFSPDGRWLGFFAGGKLKKVSLSAGLPGVIADVAEPRGAAWTSDGRIVLGAGLAGGLSQVSADGGPLTPLTVPRQEDGEVRHIWPSLSSDGRTVFFGVGTALSDDAPARLAAAVVPSSGTVTAWSTLIAGAGAAHPLAPDLIAFSRGGDLQVAGFDALRQVLAGVPQTLASGTGTAGTPAAFDTSRSGSILYTLPAESTPGTARLRWVRSDGSVTAAPDLAVSGTPALSPDGRRLAWTGPGDSSRADLWVGDLDRGAVTRLTHDAQDDSPAWSADGRRIYFARRTSGAFQLASIDAEGGPVTPGPATRHHAFPHSASPPALAFTEISPDTRSDIWIQPSGGGAPAAIVESPFDDGTPVVSADGTLLAYQSDEGGRWDVYVQRIRDGRRVVVSTAGGERPAWVSDGTAVLYQAGSVLMRARVDGRTLTVGAAERLMTLDGDRLIGVAPDGRLLIMREAAAARRSAVVAINWDKEARRLLGPPASAMPR